MKTLVLVGLAIQLVSTTYAGQELLAKSIQEVRTETAQTSEQLRATLGAITEMTKQTKGDLRPAYDHFRSQVARTESAAITTRTRRESMALNGERYFQDWQRTVDGIANESVRRKAQKRFDAVQASYGKVETSLEQANDKFKPLLSDLADIEKALAADLTAGGVKSIRGTVRSANWNHQSVDKTIKSALKEMDKMEKALSSDAK